MGSLPNPPTFYLDAVVVLWSWIPPSLAGAGGSVGKGRGEALTALEGDGGPLSGVRILPDDTVHWSYWRTTVHCSDKSIGIIAWQWTNQIA